MPLDNPLADRKTDLGSGVGLAAVQPLEKIKDGILKCRIDPDSLVLHREDPHPVTHYCPDPDLRVFLAQELHRIPNQVMEHVDHLGTIYNRIFSISRNIIFLYCHMVLLFIIVVLNRIPGDGRHQRPEIIPYRPDKGLIDSFCDWICLKALSKWFYRHYNSGTRNLAFASNWLWNWAMVPLLG
jgi:hypothetical protein